jgi:hypothetical protein
VDRVAVQAARVEQLAALPGEAEDLAAAQPAALREGRAAEVAVRAAPEEQVAPARRFLFWRRRAGCSNDRHLRLRRPSDRLIAAVLVGIIVAGITFSALAFRSWP